MYSQKRCKFLLDGTKWMSGAHERVICENEKRLCQPSTALRRQTRLLQADAILKIFFFSRRRRNTRCGRDWSSDVCSSDLFSEDHAGSGTRRGSSALRRDQSRASENRSEERRVGKECRSRWSPYQ